MLVRLIYLLVSLIMMFDFVFPAEPAIIESPDVLVEAEPQINPQRTFDKINGAGGSIFYIERPNENLREVSAADFGMSPAKEDNFSALLSAIAYCKSNPGTELIIPSGDYYLNNTSVIDLNGINDLLINGNGARLIFSRVNVGIQICGCNCVEFRNIKFDWDRITLPLSDIAVIANASPKTNEIDFVFPELEYADEKMIFSAVTQCDPETLTYGAKCSAKEVYVYQSPDFIRSVERVSPNTLHIKHNGCFDNFKNGEKYIVRHYVYDSTFASINGLSRNITFNGVSLYGYPGAGFYAGDMASHFQIINSYIGVEPGKENEYHTSLGADAIHIVNTNGCFNIAGNDISGQGDDALNVHDGLGCVDEVNGNKIRITANAMCIRDGLTLAFRNELFEPVETKAKIVTYEYFPGDAAYLITLDRDVSSEVKQGYITFCTDYDSGNYVVRDNYIHENRARGFLLQSSNGLCENNRFYKTEMQAIKVVMDISHGLWYEGKGVDRLVIRNNSFELCDYIGTGEVITVGTNIDGKEAVSQPFTNVEITGNTFKDFPGSVINVNNVNGFSFTDNKINAGDFMPESKNGARAVFGKYCSNVSFSENEWENCPLGEAAKSKNIAVWAKINDGRK